MTTDSHVGKHFSAYEYELFLDDERQEEPVRDTGPMPSDERDEWAREKVEELFLQLNEEFFAGGDKRSEKVGGDEEAPEVTVASGESAEQPAAGEPPEAVPTSAKTAEALSAGEGSFGPASAVEPPEATDADEGLREGFAAGGHSGEEKDEPTGERNVLAPVDLEGGQAQPDKKDAIQAAGQALVEEGRQETDKPVKAGSFWTTHTAAESERPEVVPLVSRGSDDRPALESPYRQVPSAEIDGELALDEPDVGEPFPPKAEAQNTDAVVSTDEVVAESGHVGRLEVSAYPEQSGGALSREVVSRRKRRPFGFFAMIGAGIARLLHLDD